MLDGFLVPLIRSALRFLQAVPQGFEQTTHMPRMIADSKLPSDHYGHSLTRPRFSPKAVSLGSLCQKLGYPGALIFAQAGCRSGWRLETQASTPCSLARFIHWLTAPSVTPRASAISFCFQPCSFSSKARRRLPSRQLLAWLDKIFSIVGLIIPTTLDFYAGISSSQEKPRRFEIYSGRMRDKPWRPWRIKVWIHYFRR
jgi:hypothetical protein